LTFIFNKAATRATTFVLGWLGALVPLAAAAQEAALPAVVPPRVVEPAPIELPTDDLPGRPAGQVVLRVTVQADGSVTDVRVERPLTPALDAAAIAAVRASCFAPAEVDGVPRAATILYAVDVPAVAAPEASAPPALTPPVPEPPVETEAPVVDVVVEVASEAEALERSAAAVTVVETAQDRQRTADLGEVLARAGGGTNVRRAGGLGSDARIAIDGLEGDQVRVFVDGVPLDLAGFRLGIVQVPVDLLERVEIYRGVVPLRFGTDALGGAMHLVTGAAGEGTDARVAYQAGAFGTHRLALGAAYRPRARGFFVRGRAFVDAARNDYPVRVEVPDGSGTGRVVEREVHRFHDGYRSEGAFLDVGTEGDARTEHASVRLFATRYARELQHNLTMTVPYGEVRYGELSAGGALRHRTSLGRVHLASTAGYAFSRFHLEDVSSCRYDWYGRCVHRFTSGEAGELDGAPHDRVFDEHAAYLRSTARVAITTAQTLRLTVAPTYVTRRGEERRLLDPTLRDPLSGERRLFTLVMGAEYEGHALADRLEARLFAKGYLYRARAEAIVANDDVRRQDRDVFAPGAGAALRFSFDEHFRGKASYELTARLPTPDEVFGDGVLVQSNLELVPERSHNVNLGLDAATDEGRAGAFEAEVTGFGRFADRLIFLSGIDQNTRYRNVVAARSVGVEASARWIAPRELGSVRATVTYQDFRNLSSSGDFATYRGDRIPNRPWLYGALEARLSLRDLARPGDAFVLDLATRYTHGFYRFWESAGASGTKQRIGAQLVTSLGAGYSIDGDPYDVSVTLEIHNLTDARVYDYFGVQRPGRAAHAKLTLHYGR
jgi:TonB family protein